MMPINPNPQLNEEVVKAFHELHAATGWERSARTARAVECLIDAKLAEFKHTLYNPTPPAP